MTGVRILWFFTYRKGDELPTFFNDLLLALWLGARFDLSAFCHLSAVSFLFWLFWLIAGPSSWGKTMLSFQRYLWCGLLLLLAAILAADFTFYGYFQDHFNALIFGLIQDDTQAILKTVWKNYPVIKITLVTITIYWLLNQWLIRLWTLSSARSRWPFLKRLPLVVLSFFVIGLGARGTLGLFPLEIMHTAISSNAFINTLSFNGGHALVRAIQLYDQQRQSWDENLIQLGYRENPDQAIRDFQESHPTSKLTPGPKHILQITAKKNAKDISPHVIVILMESWGSNWMMDHTPSFNLLGEFARHKKEDLFTPFIMPSSVATIGSLGSLLVDLPHRFYSPFLTESAFLGVNFSTAPARTFLHQGYQTHFIYGGNLGWRSIDRFLPKQGFQFLHGESDLRKKFPSVSEMNIAHDWGIYDEFVFKYAKDLLLQAKQPQFIFILTTSNHPPYTLPQDYSLLPLEFNPIIEQSLIGDRQLDHERLKVYQYANQQLGLFLTDLKESPLAAKTLIAATGDHSFYIRPYESLDFFGKWSVPLYLYLPPQYRPINPVKLTIGNHIDIFPTLYNLVFSELKFYSLGQNILSTKNNPWAFHAPSWSSFDEHNGVILNPKGHLLSPICKNEQGVFTPCEKTPTHEQLRRRLISLMGTSDFIFEYERKESSHAQ